MLQFGIWELHEKNGLVGRPENFPEVYLRLDNLWDVSSNGEVSVWKWPLQYATRPWFTPRIANDFNKAFFYAQYMLKDTRPSELALDIDINARTITSQTELLNDYLSGLDEEAV